MWRRSLATLADLRQRVGKELGWSSYALIDAARVNKFADATDDHQWIHVDADRARRDGPFGGPVAHGFLSLSLIVPFLQDVVGDVEGATTRINIGLNRLRFIAPVMVGDKLRARFELLSLDDTRGGAQATYLVECWTDKGVKAVVVESVIRYLHDD